MIPLGAANVARAGDDVTIVSVGKGVPDALAAADALAGDGIDAEVVDLRTLRPLDVDTVLESVAHDEPPARRRGGPAHRRLGDRPARRRRRAGRCTTSTTRGSSPPTRRRCPTARRSRTPSCPTRRRSRARCASASARASGRRPPHARHRAPAVRPPRPRRRGLLPGRVRRGRALPRRRHRRARAGRRAARRSATRASGSPTRRPTRATSARSRSGAATVRLTLIVDDPGPLLARAVELGADASSRRCTRSTAGGWAASATRSAIRGRSASRSGEWPPADGRAGIHEGE